MSYDLEPKVSKMIKNFFHSTVFKIAALMFSISFLAVVSMFSSVFISDGAQTDAKAVNVAGSLRLQSFRLASRAQALNKTEQEVSEFYALMDKFEQDLSTGVLVNQQALSESELISEHHAQVSNDWLNVIRPMLTEYVTNKSTSARALNSAIQVFVEEVNLMVETYQKNAEANIAMIRLIQILALFSTLILITLAMVIVDRHIEKPLSRLIAVARQLGRGDFTVLADESGNGELAVLAKTFNKMSSSLYRSQSQLEEQVKRKTSKLLRSNECLDLLFQTSRKINEIEPNNVNFEPIMQQLANVTGVKDLDLCIMTAQGKGPYEHLVTTDKPMPEKCIKRDCSDCTEHNEIFPQSSNQLKYQLTHGDRNYGVLAVHPTQTTQLEDWQHQLFEAIAEQIANGLSLKHHQDQGRRIALMNERTVIARELHDSLAQALSYLKIQVARLQKLQQKDNVQEQVDEVIHELKTGLTSAYRELRELLTTFRLKLDGQSLKATFEQTIAQLKVRSDEFEFKLDYQVTHVPFSPQEEIHLLQIAREATQNAFYHSKGDEIDIQIIMDEMSVVTLKVLDNGIGIPGDPNKQNHYGLAIMQERCRNLNGDISISKRKNGGTEVVFKFVPEYVSSQVIPSQTA